ncbi:MAG: DUF4239 domain-containing protein [Deltaproteobacteria bacterium]|nr:MAG: DUF4239 domain-containing protein [Deltaproteobacteria bacterium]
MLNVLRTVIPLIVSTVLALALTVVAPNLIAPSSFNSDVAPWEAFFSTFGLLYAIIAGFLLVTVLGRHSDLSNACEGELNAVEDVRDFLVYVDGDQEAELHEVKRQLYEYVCSVANEEWPVMTKKGWMSSDTSKELYDVMKAVDKIQVTNESDRVSLQAIMHKIADLTSLRTQRLSLAKQSLPPRLRWLTALMSVILVVALILIGGRNTYLHMGMVASVSFSTHLLYLIIADLDDPFKGSWNIDKRPFEEVKKRFESELNLVAKG